jgi:hypothetical protein
MLGRVSFVVCGRVWLPSDYHRRFRTPAAPTIAVSSNGCANRCRRRITCKRYRPESDRKDNADEPDYPRCQFHVGGPFVPSRQKIRPRRRRLGPWRTAIGSQRKLGHPLASEFGVEASRKEANRSAFRGVSGVGHELVVESDLGRGRDRVAVIDLDDLFRAVAW